MDKSISSKRTKRGNGKCSLSGQRYISRKDRIGHGTADIHCNLEIAGMFAGWFGAGRGQ